MSEGYNYQLLIGIVKVIRPNSKPVLGISDGTGKFLWLPTDKIIVSHPLQYENWQTTVFAIDNTWKIIWKDEQKWDEFKGSYPTNTKPIPQPIPPMFLAPQTVAQPQQPPVQPTIPMNQPITQTTATQPANYQLPSTTVAPPNVYQPPQTLPQQPQHETLYGLQKVGMDVYIEIIANELTSIRKLLELYIKPPKLITADNFVKEKGVAEINIGQVESEYGIPPDDKFMTELKELEPKTNKDELPNIFGD